MAGTLIDNLTEAQIEWLSANEDVWYDNVAITLCKMPTWGYIAVLQLIPGNDTTLLRTAIANDGTITVSTTTASSFFDYYNGLGDGEIIFYKNWGDDQVDSYETIELPTYSTTRTTVDTEDLVAIKDSEWTWYNLYTILSSLQSSVEVIPETASERRDLAYEWDSNMNYRIMSPYMMQWVNGLLSLSQIANYLKAQFADKWNKLYTAMTSEYDPLHNYDMHEVEHTDDVKDEDTTNSGTSSSTGTDTNTTTRSGSVDNDVYAFNSESASNDSASTTSDSSSSSGSNTASGSTSNTGSYTTDNDLDRELTRSGNIGVTTSQQLIEAELELRKYIVLDTVRDDIVNTLTIPYIGGKY